MLDPCIKLVSFTELNGFQTHLVSHREWVYALIVTPNISFC